MATLLQIPQLFNGLGYPLVGGKLNFYISGTSTRQDTWIDQAESGASTNPVILDSEGRVGAAQNGVWIRGSYKLVITDADDNLIPRGTYDNLNEYDSIDFTGLTATIADLNSTSTTATIINSTTTVVLGDRNKTLLADGVGGSFDITLPDAATAGDKFRVFIKRIDFNSSAVITILTPGSETIDGNASYILRSSNESLPLQCDGQNYYLLGEVERKNMKTFSATDNLELIDQHSLIGTVATTVPISMTLPNPVVVGPGYRVTVKKLDATAFSTTILPFAAETIDWAASLIISDQGVSYTLLTDGVDWYIDSSHGLHINTDLPAQYFAGLFCSLDAGDPTHDILMTTGVCRDRENTVNMALTSGIVKRIDATWQEGTNNGGFADNLSLTVDTWYFMFIISKDDGTVDAGYDTSADAANLLRSAGPAYAAGYRRRRMTCAVLTDSSNNIVPFVPVYNEFYRRFDFTDVDTDFTDAPIPASATKTVRCPPSVSGMSNVAHLNAVVENDLPVYINVFFGRGTADITKGVSTVSTGPYSGTGLFFSTNTFDLPVDGSSQVSYTADGATGAAGAALVVSTNGWTLALTR